jgi:hypothetical protein
VNLPCLLGHKWTPAERASGTLVSLLLFGSMAIASLIVFWFFPLLGTIMIIGSAGGLMWAVAPASIERVARWLSMVATKRS